MKRDIIHYYQPYPETPEIKYYRSNYKTKKHPKLTDLLENQLVSFFEISREKYIGYLTKNLLGNAVIIQHEDLDQGYYIGSKGDRRLYIQKITGYTIEERELMMMFSIDNCLKNFGMPADIHRIHMYSDAPIEFFEQRYIPSNKTTFQEDDNTKSKYVYYYSDEIWYMGTVNSGIVNYKKLIKKK